MKAVRAPGKALLAGEYAVLHGAPAICVAVDRFVEAWLAPGRGTQQSPFTVAALEAAARITEDQSLLQSGELGVDSTGLYIQRAKIGLGSSAAVTVAALGAALDARDRLSSLSKPGLFAAAEAAHSAAQGGRGSGVDIATAIWGGVIRFVRKPNVEVTPVTLPADLHLTFVYSGQSASTPALLARIDALARRDSARHAAAIDRLTTAAMAFEAALSNAQAVVEAAAAYGAAMAALGDAADAPIVTPALDRLSLIAQHHGGSAKPSGAGGGDLGVAFTVGSEATQALRAELAKDGELTVLDLKAGPPGLSQFTKEWQ
jgi:phosphomevalonate kinase